MNLIFTERHSLGNYLNMSFDSHGDVNPISRKVYVKVKVKVSHYRPRQAISAPEDRG